jgi:hypothetical protein
VRRKGCYSLVANFKCRAIIATECFMKSSSVITLVTTGLLSLTAFSQNQTVRNLPESVHLSITISNKVVNSDAVLLVHCKLRNSWTNAVYVFDSKLPEVDCRQVLVGADGKEFDITPPDPNGTLRRAHANHHLKTEPGEIDEWDVRAKMNETIKPGKYELRIERVVGALPENVHYQVLATIPSNPLAVTVRSP